ncbi:MAG TPA: matrixin family metalloprotease [Thermoanaerobaculia bacterium]|jgi:hypothetical protein
MRVNFAKIALAALLLAALGAVPALAGGALESIDITGNTPSPFPGHLNAQVIRIFWDPRCIPVRYLMNSTLNPIPNPLPPFTPVLSLADATTALQQSFAPWNQIPTSYIDMQVVGTVGNTGFRGFDMKNELTFRTPNSFGAIASSPSTSLIRDSNFTAGTDIDGDGDSDVSAAISVCQDVDGDGDVEFPAGFYKAGTILDNDVQFNTKNNNGLRFTVNPAAVDTVTRSVDLKAVAVHEFGHSHGLSHVLNNNKSATNGNGATMYPFIDTGDPAAELAQARLDTDDIAWSSYFYPEGTAASGPAALQPGDVPFSAVYGLITGSVTHGVLNMPVAGASVSAIDRDTGELFTSGFSGTTRLSFNPATNGLHLLNPAYNILDGRFTMPVRKGNWDVAIEPVDGVPVPAASISNTAVIGATFGQQNFNEEYWNGNNEGAVEKRSGESKNVHVNAGEVQAGIDIVTNRELTLGNFGSRDFVGFTNSPSGAYRAVRIPASQIAAILPGEDILIHAAAFDIFVTDASTVPAFAEAMLTTGSVSGTTATVNLSDPLEAVTGFVGADNDLAPFYFKNPHELGRRVRREIEAGNITDLFLVLRLPQSPYPGVSAQAPFIGLDGTNDPSNPNDVPIFGLSYVSNDGVTWTLDPRFNFRFSLILSESN